MVQLGNVPGNFDAPYVENLVVTKPGNTIANGASVDLALTAFTMPWAGSLTIEAVVCFGWTGTFRQHVYTANGASTSPAPSTAFTYAVIAYASGWGGFTVPMVWNWTALAKGQVVSPYLRVGAGAGGVAVNVANGVSANYRAWMT